MSWRSEWLKRSSPDAIAEYRAKESERARAWAAANPEKVKSRQRDPAKTRVYKAAWAARNRGRRSANQLAKAAAAREETKRKRAEKKILAYQRRLARNKAWQTANKERYAAYKAEWAQANKEKNREYQRQRAPIIQARLRQRRKTDPEFAIMGCLRNRMKKALGVCGVKRTEGVIALIGCSPTEFRQHIESQFVEGMSWENRSAWHLDHKLPCASFDLTDVAQQKACFHYSNVRPLWGRENSRKGAKVLPEFLLTQITVEHAPHGLSSQLFRL